MKKMSHKDLENKFKDIIIGLVEPCKEIHRVFDPEAWVQEHKDLIQLIPTAPLKECGGCMDIAFDALCFILKTDYPFGKWIVQGNDIHKPGIIPYWRTLFDWAKKNNYEEIKDLCENHGKLTVGLGYLILYLLSATRIENEQVVYRSLLFRDREILQKYPEGKSYVDKALDYLSRKANYKYKMGIEQDYKVFCSYVWSVVERAIPQSLEEGLFTALEKEEKIRRVPLSAAQAFANREVPGYQQFRKRKERLQKQGINDETKEKIKKESFDFENFNTTLPCIVTEALHKKY